jgi:ABC-type phosphate transport system permease subunit
MIVSLAAGQNPQPIDGNFNFINPLVPVMTMTGDLPRRYAIDRLFQLAAWGATGIAVAVLGWLLLDVINQGWDRLSWEFLTSFPSRRPEQGGWSMP